MHSLDDIEISLRFSFEEASIILTVKYHAKIFFPNLRKYLIIKLVCNPGPWALKIPRICDKANILSSSGSVELNN